MPISFDLLNRGTHRLCSFTFFRSVPTFLYCHQSVVLRQEVMSAERGSGWRNHINHYTFPLCWRCQSLMESYCYIVMGTEKPHDFIKKKKTLYWIISYAQTSPQIKWVSPQRCSTGSRYQTASAHCLHYVYCICCCNIKMVICGVQISRFVAPVISGANNTVIHDCVQACCHKHPVQKVAKLLWGYAKLSYKSFSWPVDLLLRYRDCVTDYDFHNDAISAQSNLMHRCKEK